MRHGIPLISLPASACALALLAACDVIPMELPEAPRAGGPASLSARVVGGDLERTPVEGARVVLEGTSLTVLTDADGLFVLGQVPAGRQVLGVTHASGSRAIRRPLIVREGQAVELGEVTLDLVGEVRGTVAVPGGDAAGTVVAIEGTRFQSITGVDGSFRMADVPAGPFELVALRPGFTPARAGGVVLAGAVFTVRDLRLESAPEVLATLTGTVRFSSGGGVATMKLRRIGGDSETLTTTSGASGAFSFAEVPFGVYRLTATADGFIDATRDGVAVTAREATAGALVLFPRAPSDTDADGLLDADDADDDNDGVADTADVFPTDPAEWSDADADGTGDNADPDDDNDGLSDAEETSAGVDGVFTNPFSDDTDQDGVKDGADLCPALADPDQGDADHDRLGNACDSDPDGDAVESLVDNCPLAFNPSLDDLDQDGTGDACDDDIDGDRIPNATDNCPLVATLLNADVDGDGKGDACDDDVDGDGIANGADVCVFVVDPEQADLDRDGVGDRCENDLDGDGIPDATDNCPTTVNPSLADVDGDGAGDACDDDIDGDLLTNALDRCPFAADETNADLDGDGLGDACDPDADGDDVPDARDNCPRVKSASQVDLDADGFGDACDADDDGDGVPDATDLCPRMADVEQRDLDGDGLGDACDADDDGDGVDDVRDSCPLLANPAQTDLDTDGAGDACDADDDGDGRNDDVDNCPRVENAAQRDLDGDGLGDACDDDVDGDGIGNAVDNCPVLANAGQVDVDKDRIGDACDDDVTAPPARCMTGETRCSSTIEAVESCTADGAWVVFASCPMKCRNAACVNEAVCTAGAFRCSGKNVERCNASGTAWTPVTTCAEACEAGLCTGSCTPNTKRCNGLVPETCNTAGTAWTAGDACALQCESGACLAEDLVVDGTTVTLEGVVEYVRSIRVVNGGTIRVGNSGWVELRAPTITVDATSTINADGVGNETRGHAAITSGSCCSGSGCINFSGYGASSYGTVGDTFWTSYGTRFCGMAPGNTYDRDDDFTISQGSVQGNWRAGGLVRVIGDTITIDGTINARCTTGLASGGGILLQGDVVQGAGVLDTNSATDVQQNVQGTLRTIRGGFGRTKILRRTASPTFTGTARNTVLRVGLQPPMDIHSGTHPSSTRWYADDIRDWTVSWSKPAVNYLGFYFKFTTDPNFMPSAANVGSISLAQSITIPAAQLPSSGAYYVHVVGVDAQGNAGTVKATQTLLVSNAVPTIASSTHAQRTWWPTDPPNVDVRFSWNYPAADANYSGFHVTLDRFADTMPPQTPLTFTQAKDRFFPFMTPGPWVLHVVAADTRGIVTKSAAHYVVYVGTNPGTGVISGTILDGSVTPPVPLAGATVQVNRGLFTTTTAANGTYTLTGIPVNSGFAWELRASKAGYQTASTSEAAVTANTTTTVDLVLSKP